VQRRETTITATREIRGHDAGVQLRVKRATHAMPVGGCDQTPGTLHTRSSGTAADHHRRVLEISQGGPDRLLVAGHELSGVLRG